MLRAIMKRRQVDENIGQVEGFFTIDFDAPEIERALCSGGRGEMGCDITTLVGVEILPKLPAPDAEKGGER